MSKLKVGLNVCTVKYGKEPQTYWYEGMIMKLIPEREPKQVKLRLNQDPPRAKTVPIEDIALVKDIGKGKYIPIDEYEQPSTGRKLKPSGEVLDPSYGETNHGKEK